MKLADEINTYEARISILRDKLAEQSTTYDKMQNKMFAIVGLLLTLGGLLTYDAFSIKTPDTVVEYILLIAALVMLGISSVLVAIDYRAKRIWTVPIGPTEDVKLDNAADYKTALQIIHADYSETKKDRSRTLYRKALFLNGALYMFITSVILLIVLKIGG